MRISCGKTRLVVLIGDRALKFARIRPLRFVSRLALMCFSKYQRQRFCEKYGSKFMVAVFNDVCAGLVANRHEYRYYRRTKDVRVMPVLQMRWGGLLIVQRRGEPVDTKDIEADPRIVRIATLCDLDHPRQFARSADQRIRVIDYGKASTTDLLERTRTATV